MKNRHRDSESESAALATVIRRPARGAPQGLDSGKDQARNRREIDCDRDRDRVTIEP